MCGKPSIEVLALVRCVEYFYGMGGILLVETVIINKCVKEQRDLYSIRCCCVNLMIFE
jgi:hypothetical protein